VTPFVVTDRLELATRGDAEVVDITGRVADKVGEHRLRDGQVLIFVVGSTAALTTVEFEPGLARDLPEFFERVAPRDHPYHHEETWHDGNGHSHVRSAVVGCDLTVPFHDGRLILGTWQQIVLVDFDNRPRQREIVVQFTGTQAD
jgi:secondary thiamine-phosphate synthase enzyme